MLRSISKQSGEFVESVHEFPGLFTDTSEEENEGYGRKDLQERKVLSLE